MRIIDAIDVNEAYGLGLRLILSEGQTQNSRAGKVYSLEEPLTVIYQRPLQRVLLDPARDANPFFHLFESLFYLAGRNDVRWLDRFVGDFSSRFAEEDGRLHGSYGFRWRRHFEAEGGGGDPDQLNTVVRLLKANPEDRRVVIQMWDAVADLGASKKDVPCNLMVIPRIVNGALDLTVFNRSNDFVLGLAGANAVQFSVLLEYLAGRIGVAPGRYFQISTNAHCYLDQIIKLGVPRGLTAYPGTHPMGNRWDLWDRDLGEFFHWADAFAETYHPSNYANSWFSDTAEPMFAAHAHWKYGARREAMHMANRIAAPDWRKATMSWMERRLVRMAQKQEKVLG